MIARSVFELCGVLGRAERIFYRRVVFGGIVGIEAVGEFEMKHEERHGEQDHEDVKRTETETGERWEGHRGRRGGGEDQERVLFNFDP